MNVEIASVMAVVGILMAVLADYLPKFKDWYEGTTPGQKRGVMGVVSAVVALAAFVLPYVDPAVFSWAEPVYGETVLQTVLLVGRDYALILMAILVPNQTTHAVYKPGVTLKKEEG